jgi:predicted branched-subunit amino acid permease
VTAVTPTPEPSEANRRNASWREGVRAGLSVAPTFVAVNTAFGLAAQVAGVPAWAAVALTLGVFAAPAQFAIAELAARGPSAMVQMIVVGILINLRFFVMSLTLAQLFGPVPRARLLLSAQLVVASTHLMTFFRARREPPVEAHAYFRGVAAGLIPAPVLGTALGLAFGRALSPVLAFGTTLLLPVYFALLLANDVKGRAEVAAAVGSFVLTPIVEYVLPGWGTFVAALAIGALITASER